MTLDPTWDQTLAAFGEASRLASDLPTVSFKKTPITTRVLTKWTRGGPFEHGLVNRPIADDEHGRQGGSVDWTTCGHLPTPQLCFGVGNLPGHLMCGDCWLIAAQTSEQSCDWCGAKDVPGYSREYFTPPDLYPAVYPIGPALVLFMLCAYDVMGPDYSRTTNWPTHVRHILDTRT